MKVRALVDHPLATVLLAEDDAAVREALVRALRFEGYAVTAVITDGSEALTTVAEREPDVVILDVMMPHIDGLATCPSAP